MGVRRGLVVPLADRQSAIERACDLAVRPYRATLREIKIAVCHAEEGLIEDPHEALRMIARAAMRQLGEGPPR